MFRRRRRRSTPLFVVLLLVGLWVVRQGGTRRADDPTASPGATVAERATATPVEGGATRPRGPVKRVVDGDTLVLELPGSITPEEKVRLLRINTPERGRPGFELATAALIALVEGRTIELEFEDPARPERDEYGRLLAYVHVDGQCANVLLVRGGWTRFFTRYGKGRHAEAFEQAEAAARRADAGLWRAGEWNAADVPPSSKRR